MSLKQLEAFCYDGLGGAVAQRGDGELHHVE
jgi:hypothetical protein